jgi:hypothetical protein
LPLHASWGKAARDPALRIVTSLPRGTDTSVLPNSSGTGPSVNSAWLPSGVTDVCSGMRRLGAIGSSHSTATVPVTGPGDAASNCTSSMTFCPAGTVSGSGVRTVNIRPNAVSFDVVICTSLTERAAVPWFQRITAVWVRLPSTCGVGSQR